MGKQTVQRACYFAWEGRCQRRKPWRPSRRIARRAVSPRMRSASSAPAKRGPARPAWPSAPASGPAAPLLRAPAPCLHAYGTAGCQSVNFLALQLNDSCMHDDKRSHLPAATRCVPARARECTQPPIGFSIWPSSPAMRLLVHLAALLCNTNVWSKGAVNVCVGGKD